jgi:integrase
MSEELLDCLGRRRSPAATSAFHVGRPPRNRGQRYPADPPPVEEIVAVMRAAGPGAYGDRLRAIIVVLWRAGLRVGEALALAETDLDPARGAVLVRRGKGGKRREVGLDAWGWRALDPWLEYRCRCRSAPCSVSCTVPAVGDRGRRRRSAGSCGAPALGQGCAVGWRPTSCGMPTLWRWRMRGSRW